MMAELTDAKEREFVELWEGLTREQRDTMRRFMRLMLIRQEVNAEIAAIQAAAENGRTLGATTVH
jgi:hypothetical protein